MQKLPFTSVAAAVIVVAAVWAAMSGQLPGGSTDSPRADAEPRVHPSHVHVHVEGPAGESVEEGHRCIHDELVQKTAHLERPVVPQDYGVPHEVMVGAHRELAMRGPGAFMKEGYVHGEENGPAGRRLLTHVTFNNIRITLYTGLMQSDSRTCTSVGQQVLVYTGSVPPNSPSACSSSVTDNCRLTCAQEHVLDASKRNFIVSNLLADAKEWLEASLSVVPLAGALQVQSSSGSAAGITIPASHQSPGVSGTDMLIYVLARPSLGQTIAYAQALQAEQYGRPVVGYVNFGPNQVDVSSGARKKQVAVAIHEIVHALGFSGSSVMGFGDSKFAQYTDYNLASNITNARQVTQTLTGAATSTRPITRLTTPEVKRVMSEHFGCAVGSILGGEIEDGGGSGTGGSHWEKRTFNDEFMTGTVSAVPVLSKMTLAALFDSGWYNVNYTRAEIFKWGRGQGCNFLANDATSNCVNQWAGAAYVCTSPNAQTCNFDRSARGFCSLRTGLSVDPKYQYYTDATMGGNNDLMDRCPIVSPFSNTDCRDTNSQVSDYSGDMLGTNSRCYEATLISDAAAKVGFQGGGTHCYTSACKGPTRDDLLVKVGDYYYPCPVGGSVQNVIGYEGQISCPDVYTIEQQMCVDQPVVTWPTVASVTPSRVINTGGEAVSISGSGFESGATVLVNGVAATNVVVQATNITFTTPDVTKGAALVNVSSGSEATVALIVSNPSGSSTVKNSGFVMYRKPFSLSDLLNNPIISAAMQFATDYAVPLTIAVFCIGCAFSVKRELAYLDGEKEEDYEDTYVYGGSG